MKDMNFAKLSNLANKNKTSAPKDDFGNRNQGGYHKNHGGNYNRSFGRQPQQYQKIVGESPASLGGEFYNPYTFIPFPTKVERGATSFLTIDEAQKDRFTGVLSLDVLTISPLMTCNPEPYETMENGHKKYHALTIGNDVIMPATSVRGSLRTLMTILAGGTLGYLDTNTWLCHGRDLPVGPTMNNKGLPVFLAKVEKPGGFMKSGLLRLGQSWLISAEKLFKLDRDIDRKRPSNGKVTPLFVDDPEAPTQISFKQDARFCYELKLSGRPINRKGKREGVFLASDTIIEVPAAIWETYIGRNRNGARRELKKGDIVWIEPKNQNGPVQSANDIQSIQWARWGRQGQALKDALPDCVIPDCLREDGLVDTITDLWGQVPMVKGKGDTFASRIRAHNIVFENGNEKLMKNIALAPLAQPHPGCVPFYRLGDPSSISTANALNGYKVYRNTKARGASAPWLYSIQGIFDKDDASKMSNPIQKMNKSVDLLSDGVVGKLKISCRGLSKKELALLLLACTVDWKLGGGKPLGLGHCRVVRAELVGEFGDTVLELPTDGSGALALPEEYASLVANLNPRVELYKKSQEPVELLRYPRAVSSNNGGLRREGLGWFTRHATMKKSSGKDANAKGLETLAVGGKYLNGMVLGNIETNSDPLYGYDLIGVDESTERGNKKTYEGFEPYDPAKHKSEGKKRFDNNSPNANTRKFDRGNRTYKKW